MGSLSCQLWIYAEISVWYCRVPRDQSFFHLNGLNPPNCVDEEGVSGCSCSGTSNIALCERTYNTGIRLYKTDSADACKPKTPDPTPIPRTTRSRHERQVAESKNKDVIIDDSVYKIQTIDAYDLPEVVPQWPTAKKGITQAQATGECNRTLRRTPSFNPCSREFVNIPSLLESCIMDIQVCWPTSRLLVTEILSCNCYGRSE